MTLLNQVNPHTPNLNNQYALNNISDKDLLSIWEFGLNHSLIETNLYLISCAYSEYNSHQIAFFSIGERDARLLHIREKLFGTVFQNTSNCTACGQKMEWETPIDVLKLQTIKNEVRVTPIDLVHNEQQISFRLPNSFDIIETINQSNNEGQVDQLIQKCIIDTNLTKEKQDDISEELKNKLLQKMEEKDPQANIVVNLSCSECNNEWNATFDIMQYLWTEINEWAIRLMQDIYLLAKNFNWTEDAILGMSRFRRNLYINMIKG